MIKKLLLTFLFFMLCSTVHAATYYIDYIGGSDSNNGISTNTPWQHVPGMNGFSAKYTHQAGDHFIFKGGVTWPYAAFQMHIIAGGSNSINDYYGVDKSWYTDTGSGWTRPIFDFQDMQISGWPTAGVWIDNSSYITIDNIEMKRHREPNETSNPPKNNAAWESDTILLDDSNNILIENCYIHDWSQLNPGPGDDGGGAVLAVNNGGGNSEVRNCNFDQSNSFNGVINGTAVWNIPIVDGNTFTHLGSAYQGGGTIFNNLFYNLVDDTDQLAHTNTIMTFVPSKIYNNIIHGTQSSRTMIIFTNPGFTGVTTGADYIYNNIVYNTVNIPIVVDTGGTTANLYEYVFNNTIEGYNMCLELDQRGVGNFGNLYFENNQCILTNTTEYGAACYNGSSQCDGVNNVVNPNNANILMTISDATTAGYTPDNNYAPTITQSPTVSKGMDFSSVFSVDINNVTRPAGAWDIGAYQFFSSSAASPAVSLVTDSSSYAAPANVVLTATASAVTGSKITNVVFYNGSTLLGVIGPTTIVGNTYTYSWNVVAAGTYSLTAVAYDSNFHSTTSTPVSIKVSKVGSGDVSGNGTVTMYDAALVVQFLSGGSLSSIQQSAAEITGDNAPSTTDTMAIAKKAMGL